VDDQFVKDLQALPTAEQRNVDDDDWAVDTSAEAAAARLKELSVKLPGETPDDELKDAVEEFADFLTASSFAELADQDIIDKASELEVREDKAITVLVQVALNENAVKEKQIEKRRALFSHFAQSEKSQKGLLGGIERLVIVSYPALLPSVSLILKALYDCDLVEEEVFLAWDEKASKKYVDKKDAKKVREKAAPFITWLRDADEEEDDE
jgi:translation initiation factor 5